MIGCEDEVLHAGELEVVPRGFDLQERRLEGRQPHVGLPGVVDLLRVDHDERVRLDLLCEGRSPDFADLRELEKKGRLSAAARPHGTSAAGRVVHRVLAGLETLEDPGDREPVTLRDGSEDVHPDRGDGRQLGEAWLQVDDGPGPLQLAGGIGRHLVAERVDDEDRDRLARHRQRVDDLVEERPLLVRGRRKEAVLHAERRELSREPVGPVAVETAKQPHDLLQLAEVREPWLEEIAPRLLEPTVRAVDLVRALRVPRRCLFEAPDDRDLAAPGARRCSPRTRPLRRRGSTPAVAAGRAGARTTCRPDARHTTPGPSSTPA